MYAVKVKVLFCLIMILSCSILSVCCNDNSNIQDSESDKKVSFHPHYTIEIHYKKHGVFLFRKYSWHPTLNYFYFADSSGNLLYIIEPLKQLYKKTKINRADSVPIYSVNGKDSIIINDKMGGKESIVLYQNKKKVKEIDTRHFDIDKTAYKYLSNIEWLNERQALIFIQTAYSFQNWIKMDLNKITSFYDADNKKFVKKKIKGFCFSIGREQPKQLYLWNCDENTIEIICSAAIKYSIFQNRKSILLFPTDIDGRRYLPVIYNIKSKTFQTLPEEYSYLNIFNEQGFRTNIIKILNNYILEYMSRTDINNKCIEKKKDNYTFVINIFDKTNKKLIYQVKSKNYIVYQIKNSKIVYIRNDILTVFDLSKGKKILQITANKEKFAGFEVSEDESVLAYIEEIRKNDILQNYKISFYLLN